MCTQQHVGRINVDDCHAFSYRNVLLHRLLQIEQFHYGVFAFRAARQLNDSLQQSTPRKVLESNGIEVR